MLADISDLGPHFFFAQTRNQNQTVLFLLIKMENSSFAVLLNKSTNIIIIIIKIVLVVQHTYTHTMIKEIIRKYKAMTTEQINRYNLLSANKANDRL